MHRSFCVVNSLYVDVLYVIGNSFSLLVVFQWVAKNNHGKLSKGNRKSLLPRQLKCPEIYYPNSVYFSQIWIANLRNLFRLQVQGQTARKSRVRPTNYPYPPPTSKQSPSIQISNLPIPGEQPADPNNTISAHAKSYLVILEPHTQWKVTTPPSISTQSEKVFRLTVESCIGPKQ